MLTLKPPPPPYIKKTGRRYKLAAADLKKNPRPNSPKT
jgi:hypothetical protein